MSRMTVLALGACASLVAGCAKPTHVSHQGPPALDSNIRTYAVLTHPVGTSVSTYDVFHRRIYETMARRGFTQASKRDADLLVSFKALLMPVDEAQDATSAGLGVGAVSMGVSPSMGGDVRKVVLVLLEDAKTDRVMWVGWSSGEYGSDEIVERTSDSLDQILARLPSRQPYSPFTASAGASSERTE
jgi:hypothetical protein